MNIPKLSKPNKPIRTTPTKQVNDTLGSKV